MPLAAIPAAAWLGAGATVGSGIAGGLANRSRTATQTTTPTLDPAYSGLQSMVLNNITKRLSQPTDMTGYTANATRDINRTYDLVGQNTANNLTARGLGSSPVAGAVEGNNQLARGGSIAQLINSIPLIQRQMQGDDLSLANGILSQGRGISSATTAPGNVAGGVASNMSSMLAYLYGLGAFGGGGGGSTPTIASGWSANPWNPATAQGWGH